MDIWGYILTLWTCKVGLDSQWVWVKSSQNHFELSLWLQLCLAHVQWMGSQLTCNSDPSLFLFIMSGHQLLLCCLKYTACPWTLTSSFQEDDLGFVQGLPNQQATPYFWTSDRPRGTNPPPPFGVYIKWNKENINEALWNGSIDRQGHSLCATFADMFN